MAKGMSLAVALHEAGFIPDQNGGGNLWDFLSEQNPKIIFSKGTKQVEFELRFRKGFEQPERHIKFIDSESKDDDPLFHTSQAIEPDVEFMDRFLERKRIPGLPLSEIMHWGLTKEEVADLANKISNSDPDPNDYNGDTVIEVQGTVDRLNKNSQQPLSNKKTKQDGKVKKRKYKKRSTKKSRSQKSSGKGVKKIGEGSESIRPLSPPESGLPKTGGNGKGSVHQGTQPGGSGND